VTLAVALLAAGRGRRMRGRDKLLEEVDGRPLLRRIAERALSASVGPVAVTLPPADHARSTALAALAVARLTVADADEGMAASLRAAARWARESGADGLMVCPADMPDLTAADFRRLARAFAAEGPPLRATAADGAPGHPVVFPARLLAEFAALSGDTGARDLLRGHPPRHVALPATHATTDLDTPEAWDAWRARTGTTPQP
jgi:molybdenum cofactor cytidylyltransferase